MKHDHVSLTFAALADPTRRAILARLARGEAHVSDLAKPFLKRMSLPAITKHLQVLERAGLVSKGREAQWRPCRLNAEALTEAADWMQSVRAHWEDSFDRLDQYLSTLQSQSSRPSARSSANRKPQTSNRKPQKGRVHARKK